MKRKVSDSKSGAAITALLLGLVDTVFAQGATAGKIAGFYSWLKPIVTAILLILTLVFAGRLLFKMAFRQQEAGMDLAWFIVFLAFWGLWAIFASDILSFFGVAASF